MAYTITGNDDKNLLAGTWDGDLIDGRGGNDELRGGGGNDTLIGGTGSDSLFGDEGDDLFVFNRGDGRDVIRAYGTTPGVHDRILFGDGVSPADIVLQRSGAELVIKIRDTLDQITVERYFLAPVEQGGLIVQAGAIERIGFADGMQWNRDAILARVAQDSAQMLTLGAGNDQFSGYGNVSSGAGNDTVQGTSDNQYIDGGAGDDRLSSSPTGVNGIVLLGGDGNDDIWAGRTDDLLVGGSGNDSMYGGAGFNTFQFARGWGQDKIQLTAISGAGPAYHTLAFSDVLPGAISLVRGGMIQNNDLIITLRGGSDSITLLNYGSTPDVLNIAFADGTVWSAGQIAQALAVPLAPAQGGSSGADTLYGGAGDDALGGGDGNDQLIGLDGNDVLDGGNGDDQLVGGPGNDTLIPGAGRDWVDPGAGANLILFGRANGQVSLLSTQPNADNTVLMAADVRPADVSVSMQGPSLALVRIAGSGATLDMPVFADPANPAALRTGAQLQFADGTRWDSAKLVRMSVNQAGDAGDNLLQGYADRNDILDGKAGNDRLIGLGGDDKLIGGDGNDSLDGGDGNDSLDGGAGDDLLLGGNGRDVLTGGLGNNTLAGGAGDDTYVFAAGDQVSIVDDSLQADGALGNVLRFGAGIYDGQVKVVDAGSERHLYFGSSGQIKLLKQGSGFSRVEFADGTVKTIDQLGVHAPSLSMPLPDASASADSAFSLQVRSTTFTDADGDALSYKASLADGGALPAWLRFDAATLSFSGTPSGSDVGAIEIKLTATDPGALSASDIFKLTVGAPDAGPNVAPTVRWGSSDIKLPENYLFDMRLPEFQDSNPGDVLSISATLADGSALPKWMSLDAARVFLRGAPGYDDAGTYPVKVTATDKGGLSASSVFQVLVTDVNRAPVLARPLADAAATPQGAFKLVLPEGSFSDPDGGAAPVLSATLAGGAALPQWLRFDAASATFSGTPGYADSGVFDIVVRATDSGALAASDSFRLDVAEVNAAPVASSVSADVTVTEGQALAIALPLFDDPNPYDDLAVTLARADGSALPAWMRYNPDTAILSVAPGLHDSGSYLLKASATDKGGLSASREVSVTVLDTNHAPLLNKPLPDFGALSENIFGLTLGTGNFSDPDSGDVLTLTADLADGAPLPAWLHFNPSGRGSFTGFPTSADVGSYQLRITATDQDGLSVSDIARMTIEQNLAPVLASGGDNMKVAEGVFMNRRPATFTDPNALDAMHLTVTRADGSALPAWLSYDALNNLLSGTAGYEDSGTYALKVSATDLGGLSASRTFDLVVENSNRAPLLAAPLAPAALFDNTAFSFTVPADTFTDPDAGDVGSYSAASLPGWLAFNPATRTFSGTPALSDAGTSEVGVRYTDAGGLAATATFALTVNPTASVTLSGGAGADILTGKSNNDTLYGLGGDDKLDGGLGADTLAGGAGNDSYVVDQAGDVVTEAAGAGTDTVFSSVSYTLPANVEHLTLSGSASIDATGNGLNNTLTGNSGANVLNGGAGGDVMAGNGGNDVYYVDSTSDVVTELANGGLDQLFSLVNRTLPANVEVLTLTGSVAVNGSGNSGNNLIVGNGIANALNGLAGIDLLFGGAGNDSLSDNSLDANLFGGGSGADTLTGGAARELFIGGVGNDSVNGQGGADVHAFNRGDGQDLLAATGAGDDTLSLGHGIVFADLALKKSGAELILTMGAGDQLTFRNWYGSSGPSVATLQVVTAGGSDYQPGSASAIHDNKVELFDFVGLVSQFNQARLANPSLTSWSMAASLAAFARGGSDTAAIGGDLAYHYAVDGNLGALGMNAALTIIGSAGFGSAMQPLLAGSALADGSPLLF